MKKFFMLSALAALTLGFAACSSEDSPIDSGTQNTSESGNGAYVKMTFRMAENDNTSRAKDYDASEAESSGVYSIGTAAEYHINKVYLYFFTEAGAIVPITDATGIARDYHEVGVALTGSGTTTESNAENAANKGKTYSTVVYQLPSALSTDTKYHVYALCNRPCPTSVTSPEDLLDSSMDYQSADITTLNGNLPMSARSYTGATYEILNATKANNQANPYELDFEIERSYARIAFMDKDFTFKLYNTNNPTEANPQEELGTATIQGYQLVNTSKTFYTYRHVGNISDTDFKVTIPEYSTITTVQGAAAQGQISTTYPYVIDPNTEKKTNAYSKTTVAGFLDNLLEDAASSKFTELKAAKADGTPQDIAYVAENTMGVKAQKKGQTTGIIFKVQLTPSEFADGTKYNGSADLYYYNEKFYPSIDALKAAGLEDITTTNFTTYGVRYFKGGIGYYEYYIRHFDNGDNTVMEKMEFAIVRNNSYELYVKGLAMSPFSSLPGDPDPTDPDPKDPDKPTPDEDDEGAKVYMQVDVIVRPWIVRTNNMYLGH